MKVLLDENLPQDLRKRIAGHDVFTVDFLGWKGIENGELLALAAQNGFDVVLTKDLGIEYEQSGKTLPVSVIVLLAKSNKLADISPLVPALLRAMENLQPKVLVRVG